MKKIIIILTTLFIALTCIVAVGVISSDNQSEEEKEISSYTKDDVKIIASTYETQVNNSNEAIELLKANSNFETYELYKEQDNHYLIDVTSSRGDKSRYIVYQSGIYLTITDELILNNDGVIANPEEAIMVALDIMDSGLDEDYSYHVNSYDGGYEVKIASKSLAKAGERSLIASYAINYDGSFYLAV